LSADYPDSLSLMPLLRQNPLVRLDVLMTDKGRYLPKDKLAQAEMHTPNPVVMPLAARVCGATLSQSGNDETHFGRL